MLDLPTITALAIWTALALSPIPPAPAAPSAELAECLDVSSEGPNELRPVRDAFCRGQYR